MDGQVDTIKKDIAQLEIQKNKLQEQITLVGEEINQKNKELINILSNELIGKCVQILKERRAYPWGKAIHYGIIHSVIDPNIVKVMVISFTVNNKLDKTCHKIEIEKLEFVSEAEIEKYIFDCVKEKLISEANYE